MGHQKNRTPFPCCANKLVSHKHTSEVSLSSVLGLLWLLIYVSDSLEGMDSNLHMIADDANVMGKWKARGNALTYKETMTDFKVILIYG